MSNINDNDNLSLVDLNIGSGPISASGFSDYYNDNNFIGAGVDNVIIDSQRCSILQGSTNFISGKYNCHVIGDYMGHSNYNAADNNEFASWTNLKDNTFNIGCYNGMYSWGPIFAERGLRVAHDALFGGENELRLGSTKYEEYQPNNFINLGATNSAGFIDFDPYIENPLANNGDFKHGWGIRIHNGFDVAGNYEGTTNLFISSPPGANYSPNLNVEGDVVSFYSSDKRLKNNISSLNNCLPKILKLEPISFEWNDKQNAYRGKDIGLIAQQVKEIAPEIVTERKNGYLAMKYEKVIPLLVGAIQDQQKIIEEMRAEIKQLKER